MKLLIIAMQFLTPIPLKIRVVEPKDLGRSMRWFPLVGFMIGLFLFFIKGICLSLGFSVWVTATLLLLALVITSGGLHLDGLSDMCDGFYAGKTKEEIVKIMRDPHIGIMGIIGVIFILLMKWSVFVSLPLQREYHADIPLILMPLISRWAMVIAASVGSYAHVAVDGIGKPFIENVKYKEVIIATVITAGISIFVAKIIGCILIIASLITVLLIVGIARRKLGGITGDIFGAINEISETVVLLLAYWVYFVR
jgi:adenosylcobinamide-GDP ribazoletransferase